MSIKIKTIVLQDLVAKAIKGASNNKMVPITGLMQVQMLQGILTLTTTDATNMLKVSQKGFTEEDFDIVIPVDIFSKLVAKTTTESITLSLKESSLEFTGDGVYEIELPLDEEGQLIKFPQYEFDTSVEKTTINLSTIKVLLTANRAALAETMETPCLTGYYCGTNEVITTDTFRVCSSKIGAFSKPLLVSAELMQLLEVITDEKINVQFADGKILFSTEGITIYGIELEGIADYPVEAIQSYLQTSFQSMCKLPKTALLNLLDRLSLFVSVYDKNGLYMTFTKEGVYISTKKSTGAELIKYQDSQNFVDFTCCIDIEMLKSQVNAQNADVVELWYGHDKAIKLVCGNVTQIIALLEDDRTVTAEA